MPEKEMQGLSGREAQSRLLQYGENRLEKRGRPPVLLTFAGQFRDTMVLILLAATAVSAALGELGEALTIAAIVVTNAMIGFLQELRTEKTLEALSRLAAPAAHVRRNGQAQWIDAALVVPDDILLIEAGDRVAADGAILSCASFSCDESLLTGESAPEEKHADTGDAGSTADAHASMVFMGTNAVTGRAVVRVTATGMATAMGGIAGMLGEINEEQTPLQKRLDQVGRTIGGACLAICAATAFFGVLRGEEPLAMLLTGISLAVAAVPEGLPAIVTVSLALATRRILKRDALVKRLHAVETLGCTTVICSDKTGTLTENRMTAQKISLFGKTLDATDDLRAKGGKAALRLLECACFCNDAVLLPAKEGLFKKTPQDASGEPTEAALLLLAARQGISPHGFSRESELPFDSARKRMSVMGLCSDGVRRVYAKGAPEVLLPLCTRALSSDGPLPLTDARRRALLLQNDALASQALRVLGFAFREDASGCSERDLTFLGFVGLMDPPRREAFSAIAACKSAGVRVAMITGDHEATARAVAEQLSILRPGGRVLTGKELDGMDEAALRRVCADAAVFARVTPAHKLQIVRAMKQNGGVVAMTGDGVNDAPALKEADIGVAMGKSGTDVTREASQVILLDDNFATLVAAVEEGRVIYQNIRRFLRYLLSCNTGEVLTMLGGMLLGMPVVLTPIQLLLVNLVTDGLPAIALGMEPGDGSAMRTPPRDPSESVFSGGLLGKIAFRGCLIGLSTLLAFSLLLRQGAGLDAARTGALVTLVLSQLFHVFECRSETRSLLEQNPFGNPLLLLASAFSAVTVAAAVYVPVLRGGFGTAALTAPQLRLAILSGAAAPLCSTLALALSRARRGTARRRLRQ